MILRRLFQNQTPDVSPLYGAIVAAARRPEAYAEWGVPDTLDGRFDMMVLHMFLVLERLKGDDEAYRQELVDSFFEDMDRSLRELGVGDLSVGKKVRKMAEAFYGRVAAYDKALSEEASAFEEALARNVYPDGAPPAGLAALAAYARRVRRSLAATDAETLRRGGGGFEEAGR